MTRRGWWGWWMVAGALVSCRTDGRGLSGGDAAWDEWAIEANEDATQAGDETLHPDTGTIEDPDDGGAEMALPLEHAGVLATSEGDILTVRNGVLSVVLNRMTGHIRVTAADGTVHLDRAEARVVYTIGGEERHFASSDLPLRSWWVTALEDTLGSGLTVALERGDGNRGLRMAVDLRSGASYVTATVTALWDPLPDGLRVTRISPLVADTSTGGALFLGQDPARHRILDNGHDLYFDFAAQTLQVGDGGSILFAPGNASNWTLAILDPDTRKSVVAGFLSSQRGVGVLVVDYDEARTVSDGDRRGFTRFEAISHYMDAGRVPVPDGPGGWLDSETLYVDFHPTTVHEGLESFALRYAKRIGKTVWTDIPSGWNSWGGGSGSGGLGTNINEAVILENLDLAARDFKPYGMKYFMIDDGWQDTKGDWNSHPERFPDHDGMEGMAWMAQQIRDRGMIPGLWISPFEVSKKSRLAQEHPDWWADVGPFGSGYVPKEILIPDLSRPDVLDWVESLFHRVCQEWGYRWIKVDFSYYALFATNLDDPSVTPSEAYRNALHRIRKAAGPETFFLLVAATGLSYDIVDGNRITLDNMPWWADEAGPFEQGIKPSYATVARRYFLNHRLWVNHPDLLFWRDRYGLTLEEARAWTTAVGLTGGIVKLGETFVDMHAHPAWREQVQAILPVYPASARPLDLFDREYPEVWDLVVERDGRRWHVLGLFHWGRNRDIGGAWQTPAERTLVVDLASLGLDPSRRHLAFDAWSRTWRWVEDGRVSETLLPRSTRVVVLREEPDWPEVVFTTRHLLGGAVEVHDEWFSPGLGVLSARLDTVPGQPVTVFVADAGRLVVDADTEPSLDQATYGQRDGIAWVSFSAQEPVTEVRLRFGDEVHRGNTR